MQNGSAKLTWATIAPAEKSARALAGAIDKLVRHDQMTGRDFLRARLPTALTEIIRSTPNFFMAKMLARKFTSVGNQRWPLPWRGKNTISLLPSLPRTSLSEGLPNGVVTRYFAYFFEAFHLIQAAAADDADDWLTHNNLIRRDRLGGTERFTLRLPLKLTAGRRDIVAARPAQIDLYLVIEQYLLKPFHRLVGGPVKFAFGMGIERNHVYLAWHPA